MNYSSELEHDRLAAKKAGKAKKKQSPAFFLIHGSQAKPCRACEKREHESLGLGVPPAGIEDSEKRKGSQQRAEKRLARIKELAASNKDKKHSARAGEQVHEVGTPHGPRRDLQGQGVKSIQKRPLVSKGVLVRNFSREPSPGIVRVNPLPVTAAAVAPGQVAVIRNESSPIILRVSCTIFSSSVLYPLSVKLPMWGSRLNPI